MIIYKLCFKTNFQKICFETIFFNVIKKEQQEKRNDKLIRIVDYLQKNFDNVIDLIY